MTEKKEALIDSAGWGFFLVLFVLLLGPGLYMSYSLKYTDTNAMVWIGIGTLGTATVAAILTTIANTIIQARLERKRAADRQAERKKNKKRRA